MALRDLIFTISLPASLFPLSLISLSLSLIPTFFSFLFFIYFISFCQFLICQSVCHLYDMENSFLYSPAEVLRHFGVKESSGLSQAHVVEAREKYGPNGELYSIYPVP